MDYLNRQEMFSSSSNKNPPTLLIHIVLRLIVFGANSERNLDWCLHRYSELLIFVVFLYVPPSHIKHPNCIKLFTSACYSKLPIFVLFSTI